MSLQSLSDQTLLSRTLELTRAERRVTIDVLLHLNEIERRKLHLTLGYASMFAYCTQALGYSESAAVRRIRSARCVRRFPEVHGMLERNDANISTVSMISGLLKWENRDALLGRIRGCSQSQVREIAAELEPRRLPREVIRPVVVARTPPAPVPLEMPARAASPACDASVAHDAVVAHDVAAAHDSTPAAAAIGACENQTYRRSGGQDSANAVAIVERRVRLSFTVGEAFMQKLDRIRSIAWHRLPVNPSLEQVLELALDGYIHRHDPIARHERRERAAGKRQAG